MTPRFSIILFVVTAGLVITAGAVTSATSTARPQAMVTQPVGIRYEDFPAGKPFAGKSAPVKLTTRRARMFRTELREQASKGPDFAGHYTIAAWGCGASCVQFAIVDNMTGSVYFPSFYVAIGVGSTEDYEHIPEPLQYKLESKLLMVTGNLNEAEKGGVYYYKWDNNRLNLVKHDDLPTK